MEKEYRITLAHWGNPKDLLSYFSWYPFLPRMLVACCVDVFVEDLFVFRFVSFRFKAKENGKEMFKQTSVKQTTAQTQARQPNKQMIESAVRHSLPK